MKKKIAILLATAMLVTTFFGCSKNPETEKTNSQSVSGASGEAVPLTGVKLEFVQNLNGVAVDATEEVCKQFTKETGIEVEVSSPGSNYEELIKTRMATNSLPDVFATHGWSTTRYAEYLEPLNDMDFVSRISDSIKPLITDKKGQIYTLPINMDLAGISYNVDVLNKAGVDANTIETWSDFEAACEKIKAIGVTPIHFGGKDSWTLGQYADYMAPTLLTNDDNNNYRSQLLDGTFDWSNWEIISSNLDSWNKKGYINKDAITADYMTSMKALGNGQVAFIFYGGNAVTQALQFNSKANLGMIPLPAKDANNEQTLIGGEHYAVGIWKDSKRKEEAKKFIEFLSRKDICSKLASATGMMSGLSDVESDTGILKPYYESFIKNKIRTINYFDREYLPSGMWDDLSTSGITVLSGDVKSSVDIVKESYLNKIKQGK